MPASAIIDIQSQYQDSGVKQATQDVKQLDTAVGGATQTTSGLFAKTERKISALAFLGLAEQANAATGAVSGTAGATATMARGIEVAGASMLYMVPAVGAVIVGITALYELFSKLASSTEQNRDSVTKQVQALQAQKEAYSQNADALEKAGILDKQQVQILKDQTKATQDQINALRDQLKVKAQGYEADLKAYELKLKDPDVRGRERETLLTLINIAQQNLNNTTEAAVGLSVEVNKDENLAADAVVKHWAALGEILTRKEKLMEIDQQRQQYAAIDLQTLNDMTAHEQEAEAISEQLLDAKTDAERKQLQAHLDYVNKQIQADSQLLTTEKATYAAIQSEVQKYAGDVQSAWEQSNGVIILNTRKLMASVVDTYLQGFETILAAEIAKDIGTGNFAGAAVAGAELAVVSSLAGIVSAWGGFGGSSAAATSAGGATASASSTSQTPANSQQLNVTISGGIPDQNSVTAIVTAINNFVQNSNGVLVSSTVKPAVGQVPGL